MKSYKFINLLAHGYQHQLWDDETSAREQAEALGTPFEARRFQSIEDLWYVAPAGTTDGALDAAGAAIAPDFFEGDVRSAHYQQLAWQYNQCNDKLFKVHCALWLTVDPLGVGDDVPDDEYSVWAAATREMAVKGLSLEEVATGIEQLYRDNDWTEEGISPERATALAEVFAKTVCD